LVVHSSIVFKTAKISWFHLDPKDIKAVKVLTRIISTEAKKWPSRFESSEVVPKLKVEITSRNGEKKTYDVYATYWVTFLRNEGEKKETFNWWRVKEITISQTRLLTENPPSESVASVVCTVSAVTKGSVADGTVYSMGFGDGLKARGTIGKMEATIHFIVNKQMLYVWNASYNQGAKFPFNLKSVNQFFIHNLVKEFNCKDWTLDNSLLEVPKI
jgi:hypothetical protein